MDVNSVSIPAVPEVQYEPPRDAQVQAAVREGSESEASNSESRSENNAQRENRNPPHLGNNVDERA